MWWQSGPLSEWPVSGPDNEIKHFSPETWDTFKDIKELKNPNREVIEEQLRNSISVSNFVRYYKKTFIAINYIFLKMFCFHKAILYFSIFGIILAVFLYTSLVRLAGTEYVIGSIYKEAADLSWVLLLILWMLHSFNAEILFYAFQSIQ